MDVVSGRDTGAAVVFGEDHGHLAVGTIQDGAGVDDPIVLRRVAVKVRRVGEDAGGVREGVLLNKVFESCPMS